MSATTHTVRPRAVRLDLDDSLNDDAVVEVVTMIDKQLQIAAFFSQPAP